jgi:hypothetical protein
MRLGSIVVLSPTTLRTAASSPSVSLQVLEEEVFQVLLEPEVIRWEGAGF